MTKTRLELQASVESALEAQERMRKEMSGGLLSLAYSSQQARPNMEAFLRAKRDTINAATKEAEYNDALWLEMHRTGRWLTDEEKLRVRAEVNARHEDDGRPGGLPELR